MRSILILSVDEDVMESDGVERVGGSNLECCSTTVQHDWLKGSFLQSALCQVFQRFALEGDDESRLLVHKVDKP